MAKKKKKAPRRKARTKGGFKLELSQTVCVLEWPKNWGMISEASRGGAHTFRVTARPSTVLLEIFKVEPALFTSDYGEPPVFKLELSGADAGNVAKLILESAEASKAFGYAWRQQAV